MESGSSLATTKCSPKTHRGASNNNNSKDKTSKWLPLPGDKEKTKSRLKLPSKLKINKSLNKFPKPQSQTCQRLSQIPLACPSNRIRSLMRLNSKVYRLGPSFPNWESHRAHMPTILQRCAILSNNRHPMQMQAGFWSGKDLRKFKVLNLRRHLMALYLQLISKHVVRNWMNFVRREVKATKVRTSNHPKMKRWLKQQMEQHKTTWRHDFTQID